VLAQVLVARAPVRSARAWLRRRLGNPVRMRLVEAHRGEPVGTVRAVEVRHAGTVDRTIIRAERVLADGSPAAFYVPDHLAQMRPIVAGVGRPLGHEDEVVLHVPVRSYHRFLPEAFATAQPPAGPPALPGPADADDAVAMRRFLLMFQHLMTEVTDRVDDLVDLTDPARVDPRFLPWLASWVNFDVDAALPVHQQRELVRRSIRLVRSRGTRAGIEEMVMVLTAAPARVVERRRPPPAALGAFRLTGSRDIVSRYRRAEPLGGWLVDPRAPVTSAFLLSLEPRASFAARFGEHAERVLRRIVAILGRERPAHVHFLVAFDEPVHA
jgi:phage tail-like protein